MSEKMERVKVNPAKVKKSDLMAFIYYGTVEQVSQNGNFLAIKGVAGMDNFTVQGDKLVINSFSADFYDREETVSMTECAEILVKSYNRPFTVTFLKKDDTERKLRGRLIEPDALLGRSLVEDLDITSGTSVREVDHRTIKSLIVDGVFYKVGRKK